MKQTLVVDNFRGSWTDYQFGDINSGRSWSTSSAGANPLILPGTLTWCNAPEQIDPTGSVITDMIMAGKVRVESGVIYLYAVGHTGRIYKIQVNDPTSYNPDYDTPTLLTTITSNSPTFTRGGYIDFYGATEKIYIGHDKGVTSLNFDGTGEAFVGALGSWTQNVPRVLKQFIGNLYVANGNNLAEINSTATVTTYAKLTPSFPSNTQVRDLDVSMDGNYLYAVVSRLALPSLLSTTQNADRAASSDSFIFKWNGTDTGYTAYNTFPAFSMNANHIYGDSQYAFGYNMYGPALYQGAQQIWNLIGMESPQPNAITSNGNLLMFMAPTSYNGVLEADLVAYGQYTLEIGNPIGFWDMMFINAKSPETDIIQVPYCQTISNSGIGASSNGYANNIFSNSKIYFSTLETSSAPTTAYRFYKWETSGSTEIPNTNPISGANPAYYQTQTQMFSKKVTVSEVRVYGQPWADGTAFTIDLTGSDGTPITNGSYSFDTSNGTLGIGKDYAWYNPNIAPTYAIGLGISNDGTANNVITKVEIDISPAGK